jgi:hypothetical protein
MHRGPTAKGWPASVAPVLPPGTAAASSDSRSLATPSLTPLPSQPPPSSQGSQGNPHRLRTPPADPTPPAACSLLPGGAMPANVAAHQQRQQRQQQQRRELFEPTHQQPSQPRTRPSSSSSSAARSDGTRAVEGAASPPAPPPPPGDEQSAAERAAGLPAAGSRPESRHSQGGHGHVGHAPAAQALEGHGLLPAGRVDRLRAGAVREQMQRAASAGRRAVPAAGAGYNIITGCPR